MSPVMILLVSMAQQMSMFLVIAYLLSKTPLFLPLSNISARLPNGMIIYLIFSAFCILASLFGHTVNDAIANTRAVGAVLGGLLGGPLVGMAVGLTGGLHRFTLGGFTDLACAVSTTLEGVLGGMVHLWVRKQGRYESQLFSPKRALIVTFFAELLQMTVILLIARPLDQAWALVQQIALPMLLINSIGAAMFMMMILDRRKLYNKFSSAGSDQALRLTERLVGVLGDRPDEASARRIADIIKEETQVAAVGITNETEVLAFVGLGDDHHWVGESIISEQTLQAIRENRVVFADGITTPYKCSHSNRCPLGSALVVPIRDADNTVIGTVKLYEGKRSLFQGINRSLGEGIGRIITEQMTISQHHQQKQLLAQAELKVARAQVNPHFLFNALNTINAVIKRSPETARSLVSDLSLFLRINLKRNQTVSTLAQELEHANSYLHIEQVRFADRLSIEQTASDELLNSHLPTFTVQPIVENAIKHGTSQLLGDGVVRIYTRVNMGLPQLVIEDNAGRYTPNPQPESEGLGMNIVDTRLKHHFGFDHGLKVECQPDEYTRVIIPLTGEST
jgi:two-component system, LytTR family, sensor kinase